MKMSLVSLFLLLSTTAHAGGTGEGFVNQTIAICSSIAPLAEGTASLAVYLTDADTVQVDYSNHVNDFNVSFEPIKIIEQLSESGRVSVQGQVIVVESQSGSLKLVLNPLDMILSPGDINVQMSLNGKSMQARCGYMLNNLRAAIK